MTARCCAFLALVTLSALTANAARREVALQFGGPRASRCPQSLAGRILQKDGVTLVVRDGRARRVYVEFNTERVKTADLVRAATEDGCSAKVMPYHVRAQREEIRIGIGDDEAYIHPKSRLAVELAARGTISLHRAALDRSHATYVNDFERATFMTFSVEGTAKRRGTHRVRARVVFFYCDDTICEKREAIVWPAIDTKTR